MPSNRNDTFPPSVDSPGMLSELSVASRGNMRGSPFGSTASLQCRPKSGLSGWTNCEADVVLLKPDEKYDCPMCGQVLRYPVLFPECMHRICSSCVPELVRVAPRCPVDQVKINPKDAVLDRDFQKELEHLAVKCTYHAGGCKWTGTLKELKEHLSGCKNCPVVCPNECGIKFDRAFLDKHVKGDCPRRRITCDFCNGPILFSEEIEHMRVCDKFILTCPNACKVKHVPRADMTNHLENECLKQQIDCPFAEAGCEFSSLRMDLDAHLRACLDEHTTMVYEKMMAFVTRFRDDEVELSVRVPTVDIRINALVKQYENQTLWTIDDFAEKYRQAKIGKSAFIHSPYFTDSIQGYRFSVTAYLFGDNIAKGQYLSLYVNLCKNEYDKMLEWPYKGAITLTLLDQGLDPDDRNDLSYTIDASREKSSVVSRPTVERGPNFGAMKFVLLDTLQMPGRYVRDNTMFIQVYFEDPQQPEPE